MLSTLSLNFLILSLFSSLALGQCDICQTFGSGFCPSGSGSTSPSCQCASVSFTGCSTCGGGTCFSTLAACNAACTPSPTGVLVGVALYSSSTSCSGTVGSTLSYQLVEVNRCDNLHGTGSSVFVFAGPSGGGYRFKLYSNYECSVSSPTITAFGPTLSCTAFQTISVTLFTPTTTVTPVPMLGTFTQTSCDSATNPGVTCASVFASSYTSTQSGFNIDFSSGGNTASGTVYDKGLVVLRTPAGGPYRAYYGWINGLTLKVDGFTSATTSTPRLEAVYTCSGCVATTTSTTTSPTSAPGGTISCFHESTQFAYKGHAKLYSLTDLPSECHVPHRVKSNGVAIHTTCSATPLRLTRDHLVFTANAGLVSAGQLRMGDVLYAHLHDETRRCSITRIEAETDQWYFGLNCLESIVVANGIKVSMFGTYHALPAAWMSWAGWLLGIERASQWGDVMATIAGHLKIIG